MGQKITMNIPKPIRFERRFFPNVREDDYEFNRFDKSSLSNGICALALTVITESYSNWDRATSIVINSLYEKYSPEYFDLYCFIVSPYWRKDTKLAQYFGLGKFLTKEFQVEPLQFLFEKEIKNENDIVFYGVVKLTSDNAKQIFNLLSDNENGVVFSCRKTITSCLQDVVSELAGIIKSENKTISFNLDIVRAVQIIVNKSCGAIFPYAWEETGEYHIDIFESIEPNVG